MCLYSACALAGQVSMGNLPLSFRRWDYSSILRAAVSAIHKYGSKPSLYFHSFYFI